MPFFPNGNKMGTASGEFWQKKKKTEKKGGDHTFCNGVFLLGQTWLMVQIGQASMQGRWALIVSGESTHPNQKHQSNPCRKATL